MRTEAIPHEKAHDILLAVKGLQNHERRGKVIWTDRTKTKLSVPTVESNNI